MVPDPPRILGVVPARGGSRGVRGKNLQLVEGVPLLVRTLESAVSSGAFAEVVVSTEDDEVAAVARIAGFEVIHRPAELSAPDVGIVAVLAHAVEAKGWDGIVVALQATCPLLRPQTIQRVIGDFLAGEYAWGVTGCPAPHLTWWKGKPLGPRVNRQLRRNADAYPQAESGAMTIWRTEALAAWPPEPPGCLLFIPPGEALDIDTPADLAAARQAVGRKRVLIQVACGKTVGSGHLYRAIRLAEGLAHHEVGIRFAGHTPPWALNMLDRRGLWWEGCESVFADEADMVILDQLDTDRDEVGRWLHEGKLVVTFEDEGPGSLYADLVVNELLPYGGANQHRHALYGPLYTVLRPEFLVARAKTPRSTASRILVTFGGTDPAGLNTRVVNLLDGYEAMAMVGPGATDIPGRTLVGLGMAEAMLRADLVITSQGRTQFEAARLGVPAITIAANERESRHVRCPGHLHLGLHAAVTDHVILGAVHELQDPALRQEMADNARLAVDGRGLERIVWRIDGLLRGLLP